MFSLTHELGLAASALKPLAVRIRSESMSVFKGLKSLEVLGNCSIVNWQNHRMGHVGRALCGSSGPASLPKQGHLEDS